MSQSSIEIVREFAQLYSDRLLWIEDVKCFAMYDTKLMYYEILDRIKMTWLMNNFVFEQTGKSYSTQNIQNSYLSYLTFETFKTIPSVFCPELQTENRWNYLAFTDKVLNLDNFKWEELGKDKYVFHRVPFSYEQVKNATSPKWLDFLDKVLVHEDDHGKPDKDLQKLLQQMFGYCLANTIKAQKAFFLFGAPRAGKGVITFLLETIMGGRKFVANNKLGKLTAGSFELSTLVGKKANIAGEEESTIISADTFKELTAGDTISADKKFQDQFSFTPQVKLIMSANQPLKFKYVDKAIEERLITLPFFVTVPEHKRDLDLSKKLHSELAGIMKWALIGLKGLIKDEYKFVKPESTVKAMKIIKADVSNAVKFFTENYEIDTTETNFVSSHSLYETYKSWGIATGHKGVMADTKFFRELSSVIDDELKVKKRNDNGIQIRGYYLNFLPESRVAIEGVEFFKMN